MFRLLGTLRCILILLVSVLALVGCSPKFEPEVLTKAQLRPGDSVPVPDEPAIVLLGKVSNTNSGQTLALDIATLEQLGMVRYPVHDPWLDAKVDYSGVKITELLAFAGTPADARMISVRAWDDYSVDIPLEEVERWSIMLATRDGDEFMTLENCGPTRLILPYQLHPDEAQARAISVWNIREIEVQ